MTERPAVSLGDQKQPVSLASILHRDHGQHQKHIRDRAIGDPGLAAANDEARATRFCRRLQMFRVGSGAGLRDRDRHTDLSGRNPRQPYGALGRIGKSRNEETRRHLPRGEGARQPQQPGFRCNRLLGARYRTIAVERCVRARQADLEQTCFRHRSERVGQDVAPCASPPIVDASSDFQAQILRH